MDHKQVEKEIMDAMEEGKERIAQLEAENADLRDELEEVKKPKVMPKINRKKRSFVNDLRERDTKKVTRTCACCTKRCSIPKEILEHNDFCEKCLGK